MTTIELNDTQWAEAREKVAQRFLGVGADEFAEKYVAGEYEGDNEPDFLMDVLAYFPELD